MLISIAISALFALSVTAVFGAPGQPNQSDVIPGQYILTFPLTLVSVASKQQFTLETQSMKALSTLYTSRLRAIVPTGLAVLNAFRARREDHLLVNATTASTAILSKYGAQIHPNALIHKYGLQEDAIWNLAVRVTFFSVRLMDQ